MPEKSKARGKPFEKGDPRAGRPKGTLNKATLEVKEMARALVEDKAYRARLKRRLMSGKIPPALETMLWYYAYGKPKEYVELTGKGGGPIEAQVAFYIPDNKRGRQ